MVASGRRAVGVDSGVVHHGGGLDRGRCGDPPTGIGCGWGEVVAAVGAAAVRQRFGPAGLLGAMTSAQVIVAVSGGRQYLPKDTQIA